MAKLLKKVLGGNKKTSGNPNDAEFDRTVSQFKETESKVKRVYKETQKCAEALRSASQAQQKIGHDLASPRSPTELKETSELYVSATRDLAIVATQFRKLDEETVVDPMKKFTSVFASVHKATKRRQQRRAEWERAKARVEKYGGKEVGSAKRAMKLPSAQRELEKASVDFERLDSQLNDEIPKLYEGRVDFAAPCIEALVKSQLLHYAKQDEILGDLEMALDGEDDDDDVILKQMEEKLSKIEGLSIVARSD
ncbi:bridging integrator 3-like [Oscarella lobularis]|uniref:bridging integrator 3-like n=1 Tax=Oscarella lobularis TaxID=121494 RepID=UPI00331349A3